MSDLEIEIRDIVADVLDIEEPEELDASTEFFSIGGNSLTAMMVVEAIQNQYSIDFDFSGMIQHTTIGDMSKLVAEKLHEQQENVAVGHMPQGGITGETEKTVYLYLYRVAKAGLYPVRHSVAVGRCRGNGSVLCRRSGHLHDV